MQSITTIGLDIAKSVFQGPGVDVEGNVVLRRQLKRRYVLAFFQKLPRCLVGIEACASAHHWSREPRAFLSPAIATGCVSNDGALAANGRINPGAGAKQGHREARILRCA